MGELADRIYCAGPLFNAKEQEEMLGLAKALESEGFSTFLPQRDGLELSPCAEALAERGVDKAAAALLVARAIFALDVFQVLENCQGVIVNLNGRVPDEGAVSEAAMAWRSGKPLVAYKSDSRSVFLGQDNPLVVGLFGFRLYKTVPSAVRAMEEAMLAAPPSDKQCEIREKKLAEHFSLGKRIWEAIEAGSKVQGVADVLCAQETAAAP